MTTIDKFLDAIKMAIGETMTIEQVKGSDILRCLYCHLGNYMLDDAAERFDGEKFVNDEDADGWISDMDSDNFGATYETDAERVIKANELELAGVYHLVDAIRGDEDLPDFDGTYKQVYVCAAVGFLSCVKSNLDM